MAGLPVGTPFGTAEDNLLRQSVDLVVTSPTNLAHVNSVAPNTPEVVNTLANAVLKVPPVACSTSS